MARPPAPKTLFVAAGEASGEMYAALVVRQFRKRFPSAPVEAIGSGVLREAGAKILFGYDRISVIGLTAAIARLPEVRRALAAVSERLGRGDIGAVVLVDFPGFNFRVMKAASRLGIPVIYHIPPKFWAWGKGRAKVLARHTRGVVATFPFEVPLLAKAGANAVFAGHPVMELITPWFDRSPEPKRFGLPEGVPVVGLLPGSRRGEIELLLPTMLSAARLMAKARPDVRFVLPVAAPGLAKLVGGFVREAGDLPLTVVDDADRYLLFRGMSAAIAASGTVTLELALLGVPSVIVYRASALTYHIGIRVVSVSHMGLPNLLGKEPFLPELLQDAFTPQRAADEALRMIDTGAARDALVRNCLALREPLAGPGASSAVVDMLEREVPGAWA